MEGERRRRESEKGKIFLKVKGIHVNEEGGRRRNMEMPEEKRKSRGKVKKEGKKKQGKG